MTETNTAWCYIQIAELICPYDSISRVVNYSLGNSLKSCVLGHLVANIISFTDKKGLAEEKEAAITRKRKIQAVRKVFQCTHCAFKCEKCGTQIEGDSSGNTGYSRKLNVPYNFCHPQSPISFVFLYTVLQYLKMFQVDY